MYFEDDLKLRGTLTFLLQQKCLSYIVRRLCGKVSSLCSLTMKTVHEFFTHNVQHLLCLHLTEGVDGRDRYVSALVEHYWSGRRVTKEEISQMC